MDSFELSKIAGAVFLALLLIFVPKTLIDMRDSAHGKAGEAGYSLPAPGAAEAPGAAAPAPAADAKGAPAADGKAPAAAAKGAAAPAAVAAAPAAGNAENGKSQFSKCAACHTSQKGAAHSAGPNLWNVIGRKAGAAEGFNYSPAVKAKGAEGLTWDAANMTAWVQGDDKVIPSNKMIFAGIKDPAAAADLVAYIATLSDSGGK